MRVFLLIVMIVSTTWYGQEKNSDPFIQEIHELSQFFIEQEWDEDLHFRLIIHETLTNEQYEDFQKRHDHNYQFETLIHSYEAIQLEGKRVKIIYDIQSFEWDDNVLGEIEQFINSDIFRLYFKNSNLYPCFQSQINDNISSNFISEKVVNFFNITVKNKLIENKFQVISGSTHFFEQFIPLNNDKINIQFSVREIDGTIKMVTIGTPILVIEY